MVADNDRVVVLDAPPSIKPGQAERYWRKQLNIKTCSRLNIQLIDFLLYPRQLEKITSFVNDMRNLLYRVSDEKRHKTEAEVEKIEAFAFMEIMMLVRKCNEEMNAPLAKEYPVLTQWRGGKVPRKKQSGGVS